MELSIYILFQFYKKQTHHQHPEGDSHPYLRTAAAFNPAIVVLMQGKNSLALQFPLPPTLIWIVVMIDLHANIADIII